MSLVTANRWSPVSDDRQVAADQRFLDVWMIGSSFWPPSRRFPLLTAGV
ncbi:hypothetical protein [Mycobacterium sp. 1465703.0]|nr:hypothetical protein [Mycobacterium sp. 1465703.0]